MPKVSVIVPVYNVADYLQQCVDSIINQTFKNFELILVDDGSTDNSGNMCDNYKELHNNILVVHKENGGLSDARNAGTKIARGEYIFYADSDDWLAPNALEGLYSFATEHKCDIVQGGFFYAYPTHLLYDNRWFGINDKPFSLSRDKAMHELIKNQYIKNFAWGKLYKTNIVNHVDFPKGKYFEDSYWQHLIVHQISRYGVIPKPLYFYRQRESSISGILSINNLDLLRGNQQRIDFVAKHYPHMLCEIKNANRKLAIQFTELAHASGNDDLYKAFSEYLSENNITYNRTWYAITNFAHRVYSRLFTKPLLKVNYDIL